MIKELIPATQEHAERLAQTMAAEDVLELWATTRKTPMRALEFAMATSPEPLAFVVDGEPLCVYGTAPYSMLTRRAGQPWMLASVMLPYGPRKFFLQASRDWVQSQMEIYRELENYVGAWHARSIRWLAWLGFTIEPAAPFGPSGMLFHRAHWER